MTEARPLTTLWHSNHLEQLGNLSRLNHQREYTIGTESGILTGQWFNSGRSSVGQRATYGLWGKSMQLSTFFCQRLNPDTVWTIAKHFWVCQWCSTKLHNLHLSLHQSALTMISQISAGISLLCSAHLTARLRVSVPHRNRNSLRILALAVCQSSKYTSTFFSPFLFCFPQVVDNTTQKQQSRATLQESGKDVKVPVWNSWLKGNDTQ